MKDTHREGQNLETGYRARIETRFLKLPLYMQVMMIIPYLFYRERMDILKVV